MVPETVDIYKDDKIFLKTTQAIMRNIPIGQDYLLKKWTQKQGLPNQTYWSTYFDCYAGASKDLKNTK